MANLAANVVAGSPLATGGVLIGALTATAPTSAKGALTGFSGAGYIGEDGLTETNERSTDNIRAWGGDTVKIVQTEHNVAYSFTFLETLNSDVLKAVYGEANVTTTAAATALAAPVITLGATSGTGGTFAAGTYFWKVTATDANGETVGSNEVTATIALNGTQVLNWTAITGSTGFKVWRGTTAGGQDKLVASLGNVTTYTDTGTAGTAGTVPATNTTGAGTRHKVSLNSTTLPHKSYVFEVKDGNAKIRIYVPDGQITEVSDVTYSDSEVVGYEVTVAAFADASGNKAYKYLDNGVPAV